MQLERITTARDVMLSQETKIICTDIKTHRNIVLLAHYGIKYVVNREILQ